MAVAQGPVVAAVLLLVSSGLHCSSAPPDCPESCTCPRAPLINCSSSGLSLVPQRIQDSVSELDLSHNLLDSLTFERPHHNFRNVWLGNNRITHLSLCIERNLGRRYVRGRHLQRPSRRGCVSWAPTLQLLSVERNQLEALPEGLEGGEMLQVLQLSFNRISSLRPGDLSHLRQLKELHLQHNLITSLHPQMFQDLAKLQVLDLSFNMLTSLHPSMYLSLRNIDADVRLGGNKWQCDCSMRSLRRRMAYDSSRGLQDWSVVCAAPSILSGRDLLQLEEDDLNCFSAENGPEFHRDVMVYSGSEILLSCSTQDSTWLTPSGPASVSQPQAGLLISDITEKDTGLYVCVSEEHEVVSVFNLQISKIQGAKRKTRSLPGTIRQIIPKVTQNRIGQVRNQIQSDLALAVCLSVFITFLIAFILGVLARPCIDVLWRRVTKKKSSSATNSVSSVQQRQYDNEAFSNGEELQEIETHRERRVTFSTIEYREDSNVQYYDTVASGNQESINNDTVIECEAAKVEKDTAGDSGSENSLCPEDNRRKGRDLAGRKDNIEVEHIPDSDEVERERSSSSSSDSSLSDKEFNEDQMTQGAHTTSKSPQLAKDSIQQRADFSTARKVEVPQVSIESSIEIPGFSSEPFADWSPHTNNANLKDPDMWQEDEEQFEFSDSARNTSARSSSVSFNGPKLIVAPTSDKQKTRSDTSSSSSSSYVSEGEPTQYTVNSDQEEEDKERNHNKPEVISEQLIHSVDLIRPPVGFNQDEQSSSSNSSDSDGEDSPVKQGKDEGEGNDQSKGKIKPMPRTKWRSPSLSVSSPPAAGSSSSSSESEAEITDLKVEHSTGSVNEGIKINKPETLSTDLDRQCIPQIKKSLDINAPVPDSDSSSSDESMDETTKHRKKPEQGDVGMAGLPFKEYQPVSHNATGHVTPIKKHLDVSAPSPPSHSSSSGESADETMDHMQKQKQGKMHTKYRDMKTPSQASASSSSSDSEDEITHHTVKQRPGKVYNAGLPFQESVSHNSGTQWPALDLEHVPRIKRSLDIKARSPPPHSSSSSDSDDETTGHKKKERPGKVGFAGPAERPALDLEHTVSVKKLDIKTPSLASDSSSSSDSEEETKHHKERPGKVDIAGLPFQKSQAGSHDPETRWPALDLEHTTSIKRRLDIKAPSPPSNSSSSSDSEDEATNHMKKQGQGETHTARIPIKVSPTVSYDPQTQWPALDLEHIPPIKRRLDIKAPSPPPDSSSSSDSEDETTKHIKKQERGQMHTTRLPSKVSQTTSHDPKTRWPVLDLEHIPPIKRRLDVKAPSPPPDSSSSSESEDEATKHIKKQEQGQMQTTRLSSKVSQTTSHDPKTRWPVLDLEHIPPIKRRLDVKAPSPPPDSSSSSDSEDEATKHIKKQEQGQMQTTRLSSKVSQTTSHDPKTQWPVLDLEHTTSIKRRLDIKAPSPPSSPTSSSSDSENEISDHKERQRPGEVDIAELPYQKSPSTSHVPESRWPALDLGHIPPIKRRLDIKASSPPPDSSSSSDSEDEATNHMKKQEQGQIHTRLPSKVSQTTSHDPKTQWPVLDLEHSTSVKRRLDIKAPSPPSSPTSSSSDSENEISDHKERQRPGEVDIAELPYQKSPSTSHVPESRWPALDLEHIPHIKRRLDIKAPSPPPDSTSSSDSEDEATNHMKKQEQGQIHTTRLPSKVSQTTSHDPKTQWPVLDLEHTTSVKRRLDIKAPSPPSNSSSSSDSEDETTKHIKKQEQGQMQTTRLPSKVSQTTSHDPKTQWPLLDLEHTTSIKRRLDIKAPSPPLDSSSSSDSEDETTKHIKKQEQGQMQTTKLPSKVSQTTSHDPKTQWPVLDLEHTTSVKRRLDIKAPSPPSNSSSSSDSEDETTKHIKKQEQGQMHTTRLPSKVSQTTSHDPKTQWPLLDLEHTTSIKRRLDIKAPSPPSDSSSSSDSEDETSDQKEKQSPGEVDIAELPYQKSPTISRAPDTRWPALNLGHIPHIKRRLDIKAPSPPPDPSQAWSHDPETGWPALDLGHTTGIKRPLDITAPSPASDSSSSSDSEDETTNHIKKQGQGQTDMARLPITISQTVSHNQETRWPALNLEHTTRIKRRLDIKVPSQASDSSSSSDSEGETTKKERPGVVGIARLPSQESQTVSHDREKQWPAVDLGNITRIKRRLDIKAPSPPQDPIPSRVSPGSRRSESSSSTSDEEENRDHTKLGLGVSASEKTFIRSPKIPGLKMSHSPNTDHNIKLEKYTVITDRVGDKTTSVKISTTPEINPELESRWATMNLGMSRFRKRLEITSHQHEPPNLPSTPPPDSPSSSSSESGSGSGYKSSRTSRKRREVGMQGIIHTEKSLTPENKPVNVSLSLKGRDDIRAHLERESSSSTNSDNETKGNSVPDLSLGVPRFKGHLNVKAPSTDPSNSSSSSSDSENEVTGYTAKQSRHASNMEHTGITHNNSPPTYKRLIIKPSNVLPPSGQTINYLNQRQKGADIVTVVDGQEGGSSMRDRNASLAPSRVPSMSFGDLVKKKTEQSRHTTNVDVPPEIRWTGIGRHLSDLSNSRPSSRAPDNSSGSTHEILRAVSDTRERKGLHALKAMSSERREWDTQHENVATGASPLFDDHGPQVDASFNYQWSKEDIKPLAKQPLPQRRAADLLYGIPRYRSHNIGSIKPPQEAPPPPPTPATPPPDDAVGLTWRSLQSSKKGLEGTRSYAQQSKKTEESASRMSQNLADYFESSKISEV